MQTCICKGLSVFWIVISRNGKNEDRSLCKWYWQVDVQGRKLTFWYRHQLVSKYKFLFSKKFPLAAWKCSTRIDRSCCGGIFTRRFVHFYIKKISAGQKVRHLLANSFEVSILNHFLQTWKSTITTSFTSRQNWIFGRIGDQEGAISDPDVAERA